MSIPVFVIKPLTAAAVSTLADWVAAQGDKATYLGALVMTTLDCHLPGDIVFLLGTEERNLHNALAQRSEGQPWEGSILRVADFDNLHDHSRDVLEFGAGFFDADHIRKIGEELLFPADGAMYLVKGESVYELRQKRFRASLLAGREHAHDVCAVASTLEQLRSTISAHFPGADYSGV